MGFVNNESCMHIFVQFRYDSDYLCIIEKLNILNISPCAILRISQSTKDENTNTPADISSLTDGEVSAKKYIFAATLLP